MRPSLLIGALVVATALAGACHHHHDDRDHGHGHDEHDDEPAVEPMGHGHGHAEDAVAFTRFAGDSELFVEVPPLIVGETVELAAHLTVVSTGRPVTAGTLTVTLRGGSSTEEVFTVDAPAVPGIFRPKVTPKVAARREVLITLSGAEHTVEHRLLDVPVFPSAAAAAAATNDEDDHDDDAIAFLKEQQWRMDFRTAAVTRRRVRESFEAHGTIRARGDGEAYVSAPVTGRVAAGGRLPAIGARVEAGQALARLVPQLADAADTASLDQAVAQARTTLRQAERERARLAGLLRQGAVAERRVVEARYQAEQARHAVQAAERRRRQAERVSARAEAGGAEEGIAVRAPITGTVVAVETVPGAFVDAGARLFRVVDLEKLWLEIHVAEVHARFLSDPGGAWFTVEGFDDVFEVGPEAVVTTGGVLDARSRTVPLIVAIGNADGRLRVGMFANAHVIVGPARDALAVPRSAIVVEQGLPIVYVMSGGESFERRMVRLGARDGDHVEVTDGLAEGDRVVVAGAYAVRLAATASSAPAHGHHH